MDQKLTEIFVNWKVKLDRNEWYFIEAFDSISNELTSEEAYNYIPNVISILFTLEDDFLIWNSLYFLIHLYNIAKTTEIHIELYNNWKPLTEHISSYHESYNTPFQGLKNK